MFPNSAPDWLTPKYLNFVVVPEQTDELGPGAAVVGVGVPVAVPGWH